MYPAGHEPIYSIKLQVKNTGKAVNTDTKGAIESVRACEQGYVRAFFHQGHSMRASSRIWTSEASLARRSRFLTRLALLAQIGELARRLPVNCPY